MKRGPNCEHYDRESDFTLCARNSIQKEVLKRAKCVSHITKLVIANSQLPECETDTEKLENNAHVQNGILAFTTNTSKFGCPLPCSFTQYSVRVNYFDEIDETDFNGSIKMHTYFDTMAVEIQEEILVYDWPRFLSALGGTLGLYLGFSCFSVLIFLIEIARRIANGSSEKEDQRESELGRSKQKSPQNYHPEVLFPK